MSKKQKDDDQPCVICKKLDDKPFVACDSCDKWFHFECVGVDESIEHLPWICDPCKQRQIEKLAAATTASTKESESIVTMFDQMFKIQKLQMSSMQEAIKSMSRKFDQLDDLMISRTGLAAGQAKLQTSLSPEVQLMNDVREPSNNTINQHPLPVEESFANTITKLTRVMNQTYERPLPKFDGNLKQWAYFHAAYMSTTAEGEFTETQNVSRLKEALSGNAQKLVIDQLCFSKSATEIIECLENMYGRPEDVLKQAMTDLLKHQPLTKVNDEKLPSFAFKVKSYVAQAKSMRCERDLNQTYGLHMLHGKLAGTSYHSKVHKLMRENANFNLEDFANFLMEKVREMPSEIYLKSNFNEDVSSSNNKAKKARVLSHDTAQVDQPTSSASSSPQKKKFSCAKFNQSHPMWKCDQFKKLSWQEKYDLLRQHKVCFKCLNSSGHLAKDCFSKRDCNIDGCKLAHNSVMHKGTQNVSSATSNSLQRSSQSDSVNHHQQSPTSEVSNTRNVSQTQVSRSEAMERDSSSIVARGVEENYVHHENQLSHQASQVLFQVVPIRLYGKNRFVDTHAFLDSGSTLTMMERRLYEELELTGEDEQLNLKWTSGVTRSEMTKRTNVLISGVKHRKTHQLMNVYAVNDLDLPTQTLNVKEVKQRYKHLRGLHLEELEEVKPTILIGIDHARFLAGKQVVVGNENDPVASKSLLGWTVFGISSPSLNIRSLGTQMTATVTTLHHNALPKFDEDLHNLVKGYFSTENFGVSASKRSLISKEDERALEVMNNTMKKVGDRYEIGLIWKSDEVKLPNSLPMAMKRLHSEEKSVKKKDLLQWKNDQMRSLIDKGYARIATDEDLNTSWPRVWYAPTFVVINPNKIPLKPRNVADVAAQVDGVSLNTMLLKGPDNMAPLLAGLFRFREYAIAVNADVKEMFHQIRIIHEDQQCQRILWRDGDDTKEPTTLIFQAMMFGPVCSPSCAQHVKNYHANLYRDKYPEAVDALINSTYVDDYFNSHPTVEKAEEVTLNAIEICAQMSFDLVGVQSNSLELLKKMPQKNIKEKLVSLDITEAESFIAKVLGMYWRAMNDTFTFVMFENETTRRMQQENFRPTKRQLLSTLMKIFDPLGLIAKFTIKGKVILQEIWRFGVDWDEEIPENLKMKWMEFMEEMKNIVTLQIPRHYSCDMPINSKITLIVFVDASEEAFAAVAYFRFEAEDGRVHVSQVMAKAKVAPIKQLSIPQLELQAAVMGARLAATVKKLHTLDIQETVYLTDSKCVQMWICSRTYKFKSFVAVRIGEILDTSSVNEWSYVNTHENVADEATRSENFKVGDVNSRWFKGPEFLLKPRSDWPVTQAEISVNLRDVNATSHFMIHVQPQSNISFNITDDIKPFFKSSWMSYVRVLGWLLRLRDAISHRQHQKMKFLTPSEIERAENFLFRKVQHEVFAEEIQELKKPNTTVKPGSKLITLSPFIDAEGVMRMSSRAQNVKASYSARNPVILPNKHELVDLFIVYHHQKNQHMREETTIADIREQAWIVNIRSAHRRVKSNCQLCKLKKAKPVLPLMGQLPDERLDFGCKAFTHVGIDCFGPINLKQARSTIKRYGIIFTCLTYRAVYLELLVDMSLDQVMIAIRSLFARRGKAKTFYSDNGTNFVGSNHQLARDIEDTASKFGKAVADEFRVTWKFTNAFSPWMGGSWERLIQSIKKSLDFTFNGEEPREDVYRAALIEAEFHMNRRPLTHTPVDPDDLSPLTPNLALFGDDGNNIQAPGEYSEKDQYNRLSYRRVQHFANKFKVRWINEYLPEITRRSKWYKDTKPIEVGDLVIIVEPNESRNEWRKGRVHKLYPGRDGITRTADVILADKTIKPKRSVGRLAVLDVAERWSSAS